MMKKRILSPRIAVGLILFSGLFAAGSLFARWPVLGVEWGEVIYYNNSGTPVGGFWVDCNGGIHNWGIQEGRRGAMQLYRCN